jgi:hypothetical protein
MLIQDNPDAIGKFEGARKQISVFDKEKIWDNTIPLENLFKRYYFGRPYNEDIIVYAYLEDDLESLYLSDLGKILFTLEQHERKENQFDVNVGLEHISYNARWTDEVISRMLKDEDLESTNKTLETQVSYSRALNNEPILSHSLIAHYSIT